MVCQFLRADDTKAGLGEGAVGVDEEEGGSAGGPELLPDFTGVIVSQLSESVDAGTLDKLGEAVGGLTANADEFNLVS